MTNKTELYTRAIYAVRDAMKDRGFGFRTVDTTPDEIVVFFENATAQYGIVLSKPNDPNNLIVHEPFELTRFKGKDLNSREKFVIPLNATTDEEGIKNVVNKWLDVLLP